MSDMICLYCTLEGIHNMRLPYHIIEAAGPVFEG
jgi:hypothetical protein